MIKARPIVLLCSLLVLFWASCTSTFAQGRFGQWVHTSWTEQQGAPSMIFSLAKSPDGFLWVGSADGLFRFEGSSFEKVRILGSHGKPGSSLVYTLFTASNGDVWMSTADSIGWIHQAQVHLIEPGSIPYPTHVRCFAEDRLGQIWIASWNGLYLWKGGRLEQLGEDRGLPLTAFYSVAMKRDGTLLATSAAGVFHLKSGARIFEKIDAPIKIANQILEDASGRIWVAEDAVHPLVVAGSGDPLLQSSVQIAAFRVLFDPDGKLWVTSMDNGLTRVENPQSPFGHIDDKSELVSRFTAADGLTDNSITSIIEDESGAIWTGTRHGLDCFRKAPISAAPFSEGYTDVEVRPGRSGDIWIAENLQLTHATFEQKQIHLDRVALGAADFDKPAQTITSSPPPFCSDYYTGVICSYGSTVKAIRNPPGLGSSDITGRVCLDRNQALWLITSGSGVFSYSGDTWKSIPVDAAKITLPMSTAYTGRTGNIWFAFSSRLMMVKDGVVRDAVLARQIHIGTIQSIVDDGDRVWLGGTRGLAYLYRGRAEEIIPEDPDALTDIREMREGRDGGLWVSTGHGVLHLDATSLQRALADAAYKVPYHTLGAREGLIGHGLYSIEIASDGALWLVSHENIIRIDLLQMQRSVAPPVTMIRSLEANGKSIPLAGTITLPPHTTNLKFRFVGIDLADPRHVTYRYSLTNVDKDWQSNGAEQEVMYTNLSPGKYEFHVLARSSTGIWSPDNAKLQVIILPAWYQRLITKTLALLALLVAGWLFFRSRIRQAELAAARASDIRLAERMRIAEDLHDTFLQTVQGSKIVVEDLLSSDAEEARTRSSLVKLSQWLELAVVEGRTALYSLKAPAPEQNHLAEFLERTATEHCRSGVPAVTVVVTGKPRDLHPIVQKEIVHIAEEAIRNACTHARATTLSIELGYARDLSLRVKDDGVGIEPQILKDGRTGHFGMHHMKDRSARVRATLSITSAPGAGTEISLKISGALAYRKEDMSLWEKLSSPQFWSRRLLESDKAIEPVVQQKK